MGVRAIDPKGDAVMRGKIAAAGVAALAVAGGGAAIAANTADTPQAESKAIVDDAAQQLGVTPSKLSAALKQALENRVDAAVAAGRLTKAEGDALKARIEAQEYPLLGGMGLRHQGGPGFGGHLTAAGSYLGLSEAELRTQLESGKTLADLAKAQGKSVDGLVDALVADEKKELDQAVADGRLTQTQADELLAGAKQRVTDLVNGTLPQRGLHPADGPAPATLLGTAA